MAQKDLSGLFTPAGTEITTEVWAKQYINKSGIPILMSDAIGVSYTVSKGTDDMGDPIDVATIVTLEDKLTQINSAINEKGTGSVSYISINGAVKFPSNGTVDLGTGFLTSADVTNKSASLTPNTTVTLATIGGKNITAAVPAHKLSIATPTVTQSQGSEPLTITANPSITTNAASAEENISIQNIKLLGVDTNTKVTVNGIEIGLSVVGNKICLTSSSAPVETKEINAITMTAPNQNFSQQATKTSTYPCTKTITPSDYNAGGPVTLSLYSNSAHTTKYTGTAVTVNGDTLTFTAPDKVYPRYESANGKVTASTSYVEYKATQCQFDLASNSTSVTIGGSASTVNLTSVGISKYTASTNDYFTISTSSLSKVTITPKSGVSLDTQQTVDVTLTPTPQSGVWYDSSSVTTKTLKVTVKPAAAVAKYGYYGIIDMPEDGSFMKESTFTKDITSAGDIAITPINQKVIAVLTKVNEKPTFKYETGGQKCTGNVFSGTELGLSTNTMSMNSQMYYVWLVADVMSASWTNVVLTIK